MIVYMFILNALGFGSMGFDKRKAIHKQWRTEEKTLMAIALAGGSLGILMGMKSFRHKTQKPLFKLGVPIIIGLQFCLSLWLIVR